MLYLDALDVGGVQTCASFGLRLEGVNLSSVVGCAVSVGGSE